MVQVHTEAQVEQGHFKGQVRDPVLYQDLKIPVNIVTRRRVR
jgi:hypothetical protein